MTAPVPSCQQMNAGAKALADELDKAMNAFCNNPNLVTDGAMAKVLWNNKAGIIAYLKALSAPAVSTGGEPVAWRCRDADGFCTSWFDGKPPENYGPYEVAYATLPAAKAAGDQLRDPKDALSAFTVLKDQFPELASPDVRAATIEECVTVIGNMRQSGAGLFDAKHSGQRGQDRSDALYDAYQALRALSRSPATDGGSNG